MKKIILALALIALSIDVYAAGDCNTSQIEQGRLAVANVTYELEYGENVIDMNGDKLDNYLFIRFPNLPDGYKVTLSTGDDVYIVTSANSFETIQGGVYTVKYYSYYCDTVLRSFEMRVPLYKLYCGATIKCDEDPWFDGTFTNTASAQSGKKESKVSTKLVIILVVLLIVIIFFVAFIIKRRRDREKSL